jgi:hypothetical protein
VFFPCELESIPNNTNNAVTEQVSFSFLLMSQHFFMFFSWWTSEEQLFPWQHPHRDSENDDIPKWTDATNKDSLPSFHVSCNPPNSNPRFKSKIQLHPLVSIQSFSRQQNRLTLFNVNWTKPDIFTLLYFRYTSPNYPYPVKAVFTQWKDTGEIRLSSMPNLLHKGLGLWRHKMLEYRDE